MADTHAKPSGVSACSSVTAASPQRLLRVGDYMRGNAVASKRRREVVPASDDAFVALMDTVEGFTVPQVLIVISALAAEHADIMLRRFDGMHLVLSPVPSAGEGQHVPLAGGGGCAGLGPIP